MSTQNTISAILRDEAKARILQNLAAIRADMEFLITLEPEQVKALFKAANGYSPYIDKAHAIATAHPEILPAVLDVAEFHRDYDLIQALTPIQVMVEELAKGIHDTLLAANSDAMMASMEVYAAVKQHKDKVAGLSVAHDELAVFFHHSRRKPAAAKPPVAPPATAPVTAPVTPHAAVTPPAA